jgi:hypothetical protein
VVHSRLDTTRTTRTLFRDILSRKPGNNRSQRSRCCNPSSVAGIYGLRPTLLLAHTAEEGGDRCPDTLGPGTQSSLRDFGRDTRTSPALKVEEILVILPLLYIDMEDWYVGLEHYEGIPNFCHFHSRLTERVTDSFIPTEAHTSYQRSFGPAMNGAFARARA